MTSPQNHAEGVLSCGHPEECLFQEHADSDVYCRWCAEVETLRSMIDSQVAAVSSLERGLMALVDEARLKGRIEVWPQAGQSLTEVRCDFMVTDRLILLAKRGLAGILAEQIAKVITNATPSESR